jgi:hypothetical protein
MTGDRAALLGLGLFCQRFRGSETGSGTYPFGGLEAGTAVRVQSSCLA